MKMLVDISLLSLLPPLYNLQWGEVEEVGEYLLEIV